MNDILIIECFVLLMCFVIWKFLNAIDRAFGKRKRSVRDRLMADRCIALAESYKEDVSPSCTKQTTEAYYERETNIRL